MLTTKRKPKVKLENDSSKKYCNFLPILAKIMPSILQIGNSIAMATVDVPWDWFVFKIKAH